MNLKTHITMKTLKIITSLILLLIVINSCAPERKYNVEDTLTLLKKKSKDSVDLAFKLELELKAREQVYNYQDLDSAIIIDSVLTLSDTSILFRPVTKSFERIPELFEYSTDTLRKTLSELNKVIYGGITGGDGRIEYYQETEERIKKNANGVVALFLKSSIIDKGDGTSMLKTEPFSKYDNVKLCGTERFKEQPKGSFCTGFIVGKNLIVTAGHCLKSRLFDNKNFVDEVLLVSGFRLNEPNKANLVIKNSNIYKPIKVVQAGLTREGIDFAVLEVDAEIDDSKVLELESRKVNLNENVYVIGHPVGLPLKIAKGAQVKNNTNSRFFMADLDTYGGNSGSPVFDSNNKVIGILVRGARDFIYSYESKCYTSNVCPTFISDDQRCGGESVSRTNQFIEYLNL